MNFGDLLSIVLDYEDEEDFYIYGDIPERKLKNACESYPLHQDDEILALVDATVFGSAKNGMLIGLKGIYFKSDSGHSERSFLSWADLSSSEKVTINLDSYSAIKLYNDCNFDMSGSSMKKQVLADILNKIIDFYKNNLATDIQTTVEPKNKSHNKTNKKNKDLFFNDIKIMKYMLFKTEFGDKPSFLVYLDGLLYISTPDRFVEFTDTTLENLSNEDVDEEELANITALLESDNIADESTIVDMSNLFSCAESEHYKDGNMVFNPILNTIIGVKIDTSNVTIMNGMFSGCTSLKYLDINTSNVTIMQSMFSHCRSLKKIPRLNTDKVINMDAMFMGCTSLKKVKNFNMDNVTLASFMFSDCTSLKKVHVLNSNSVDDSNDMFYNCTSLKDVINLDMSNASSVSDLFRNCINLQNIKVRFYPNDELIKNYLDSTGGLESAKRMKSLLKDVSNKQETTLTILVEILKYYTPFYGCDSLDFNNLDITNDFWFIVNS